MRTSLRLKSLVLAAVFGAFGMVSASNAANLHTPVGVTGEATPITQPGGLGSAPEVSTIIYDNSQSGGTLAGIASGNFTTTWGDTLNMTAGTGTLEDFRATVFNASATGNYLNTAVLNITFLRASDSSLLGSFSGNVNFGAGTAGLNGGFFSTITFTTLSTLATPIVFDTANVLVKQQLGTITQTGALTSLGVVSRNPPTVGSSPADFYKDDPSSPPAGFYTFVSGAPANVVYQVGTAIPEPASIAVVGLAALGMAARRRRA